jgi:NAD(P)-dependent dehydrogenase (short-subunit alcohol dehydrogenase family)
VGVPDVIVNSAGLGRRERIEDTPPDEARSMIGAPYLAAFNVTHAFMPDMLARRSGVLVGTGVHSCEAVFGEVASEYHQRNPGVERHLPGISRTIRTLVPDECAQVITDLAERPRPEVVHPFMLRLYRWQHRVMPGVVRWVLWRTGARRRPG